MDRNTYEMLRRLEQAGLSSDDAFAVRRCAMTLHRWFEQECGNSNNYCSWSIERDGDEPDSTPYRVVHSYAYDGKTTRTKIADRETGARKRLADIIAKYPSLGIYIQGDPRGAPVYVVRLNDMPENRNEWDTCYSRGIAVY